MDQARKAMLRLRTAAECDPEITRIQQTFIKTSGDWKTDLLQSSLRTPLIIGIGLAAFQQLSGINTVIYYAPTIFGFAGFKGASATILGAVWLGVVMIACHVLAIFLLDRVGRRPLLLVGVAGQVIALAVLGAAFQFRQLAGGEYIAVGSLAVYVSRFAFGLGPVFGGDRGKLDAEAATRLKSAHWCVLQCEHTAARTALAPIAPPRDWRDALAPCMPTPPPIRIRCA